MKTGTDPAARFVSLVPVPSTIAELSALPAPHKPEAREFAEDTVYAIPCRIILAKYEADGDVHLALTDEAGRTMIGEIPSPDCAMGSVWLPQITAARAQFDTWPRLGKKSLVCGVAFFDHNHGQDGVAPNGIELHPVLSIIDPTGAP